MSEHIPQIPQPIEQPPVELTPLAPRPVESFDLREHAASHVNGAEHQKELFRQGMTDEAGIVQPEAAHSFVNYLDQRPESEAVSAGDDLHYNESMPAPYAERSLKDLASQWAQAEVNNDRTTAEDVQAGILDRLENTKGLSDDMKSRLIDRVHAQKEAAKAAITGEAPKRELPKPETPKTRAEMIAYLKKIEGELTGALDETDVTEAETAANKAATDAARAAARPKVDLRKKVNLVKSAPAGPKEPDTYISDKEAAETEATELNNNLLKMNQDASAAVIRLGESTNRYAEVSANQRGSHLGRLEEAEGGRFRSLMRRLNPMAGRNARRNPMAGRNARRNPMAGRNARRNEAADAATETQRDLYRANLQNAVEAFTTGSAAAALRSEAYRGTGRAIELEGGVEASQILDIKFAALDQLENRIQQYREDASHNGEPFRMGGREVATDNRRDRLGNWLAENWQNSGRVGKVLKVAAVPAVVGGAIGFGVATAGVGPLLFSGAALGTGLAGGRFGSTYAESMSRRMSATEQGRERAANRAQERRDEIFTRTSGNDLEVAQELDITNQVENGTTREVRENQARRKNAAMVGRIAAAAGFLAGGATEALTNGASHAGGQAHHAANTHHTEAQGPKVVAGANHGGAASTAANHAANIDPNQAPWSVAHAMPGGSGHEFTAIHHTMNTLNSANPNNAYHLVHANGVDQVYNGHHALNTAQQIAFNKAMEATTIS